MKQLRLSKMILTVAIAFFMALSCLLIFSPKTVMAEDIQHFTGTYKEAKYENDSAVFTVGNNGSVVLSNYVIANALAFDVTLGDNVEGLTVSFETASFDVNGNVDDQGEIYTTVKHKLTVKFDGSAVIFNETNGSTTLGVEDKTSLKIYFAVDGNTMKASVNGKESFVGSDASKYLVSNAGGCVAKNVTINANLKTGVQTSTIAINSIDQNYLDTTGAYKQTFVLENGEIKTQAKARIILNDTAYVETADGYKLKAYKGELYTYSFTAYSILETLKGADLFVKESSNLWISNEDKPKTVVFKQLGNQELSVGDAENVYETFTFEVSDKQSVQNTAPVYKDATVVEKQLESYKLALKEATLKDYNGKEYCIRLGDKVKLPSLENFVYDDYTSYSQLKYTVHYRTPETTSTTSKLEIPTDKAGKYEFFVVFEDINGDKMSTEDFYTFDENDSNNRIMGKYGAYVFSFEILDNAPINITAVNQSKGYVGTKYTVSKFNVSANGYTPTYELYYNADASKLPVGDWEQTWTRIPKASEVSETDVMPEGFTYEDIQNINYDGQLTFTPDRTGKFVVKCTVSSTSSVRSATATASVEVKDAPTIVRPVNTFVQDNVWSVVFLSAGTICLIILIILLFVQPKEKIEEED
ncbi:MAG: hypothetical protein IKA12_05145 [Clostridia bacterium]|nr:hypothetical protein [Clostridia bacterium]